VGALAALGIAACGGGSASSSAGGPTSSVIIVVTSPRSQSPPQTPTQPPKQVPTTPKPAPPPYPELLRSAQSLLPTGFVPAVLSHGQAAAWIAHSQSGVAALSFNQRLLELVLHSGTVDAGGSGWRWGPGIAGGEQERVVAAFNGGFRFSTDAGGFMSDGRVGAPLRDGLG
jgi:hypothetical protein